MDFVSISGKNNFGNGYTIDIPWATILAIKIDKDGAAYIFYQLGVNTCRMNVPTDYARIFSKNWRDYYSKQGE